MKKTAFLLFLLVLVASCTTQGPANEGDNMDDGATDSGDGSMHIGCQEGEIDINGECQPALQNNAGLFSHDTSSVETMELSEPLGYLARPKEEGEYPGVVMIHEWWGLNDNIKEMARILASEGYVVFAVDLYEGEVATESSRAGELAGSVRANPEEAVEKMKDAVAYLREEQMAGSIGSLGWCFGGAQSLQLSLNEEIDATVIYYGSLVQDEEQLENLKGPLLGIFGEEDTSIPVETVNSFESSLDGLHIDNDIYIYSGVGHAFANPSGSNYAAEQTEDAWVKTVEFLNKNLKSSMMEDPMDAMDKKPVDGVMMDSMVVFGLTGENFKFVIDGQDNPTLRVKLGDTVRVEFASTDGFHDFVIAEFDAKTEQVQTGGSTFVEFVADQAGTFEYYCSVGKHRQNGMWGNFIVE